MSGVSRFSGASQIERADSIVRRSSVVETEAAPPKEPKRAWESAEPQAQSSTAQASKSLSSSISAAVADGGLQDPQLSSLKSVGEGVKKLGGTDVLKSAFKGEDGSTSIEHTVRTTSAVNKAANEGLEHLAQSAFKGIDSGVDSAFRSLDETFTPQKTLSEAVGKFKEAKATGTKWETVKASAGVAFAGIKGLGSGATKNIAKLGVGIGGFVAGSGVAATGIASRAVIVAGSAIGGSVEAVGRVVIAPALVATKNNAIASVGIMKDTGKLLQKVNKDFDITGGTADTFKDAFKGEDGKYDIKNAIRTTDGLTKAAHKGVDDLVGEGFKGIESGVKTLFKGLDDTFTPGKTLSDAVGKFKEAKATGTTWEKIKAGAGVAFAGIKATGSAVVKNVAKLGVGIGGFVAGTAVAAGGIAAKSAVTVLGTVAKAGEAVGRVVVAPVLVAAGNTIGKVGVGAAVIAGGSLAVVGKMTGLSYVASKVGSGLEALGDKIHTSKGKESMNEIDKLLADPDIGISKEDSDAGASKVKKDKGQDFDTLGFKGTAKKWFNMAMNGSKVTVGDNLAGKNQVGYSDVASASSKITYGSLAVSGAKEALEKGKDLSHVGNIASAALPFAAPIAGFTGVIDGAVAIGRGSYDIHNARKMGDRVDAFKDPIKLAARLEAKATKLDTEAAEVAKGGIIADPDPAKAKSMTERATALRADAAKLKEMQVDPEMASIAKQVGSRHGMGISAVKIARNTLSVAGGTLSATTSVMALAAGTALVANPAGPVIVGVGVAVGAGVAAYKINKELKRENVNNKLEAQTSMIDEKLKTATGPAKEKLEAAKAKIMDLRAKKDPEFAAQRLVDRMASNPDPSDKAGIAAKEQAVQFVKNVLKLDPDKLAIAPKLMPVAS